MLLIATSLASPLLYSYDDIRDLAERWAHERIWPLNQTDRNIIAQYLYYQMALCDLELIKHYDNYPYRLCTHFDAPTVMHAHNSLIQVLSSKQHIKTKTALIVSRLQKYIQKQTESYETFLKSKIYQVQDLNKNSATVLRMDVLEHQRYVIWIFYGHLYGNLDMSNRTSKRLTFIAPFFTIEKEYQLPEPYSIKFTGNYRHYTIPPENFCIKHSKKN